MSHPAGKFKSRKHRQAARLDRAAKQAAEASRQAWFERTGGIVELQPKSRAGHNSRRTNLNFNISHTIES